MKILPFLLLRSLTSHLVIYLETFWVIYKITRHACSMRLNLTVWIDCAFLRSKVRVQRHRRCVFHWLIRILQSSSQFRRMSKWWINSPLSNLCQRTKNLSEYGDLFYKLVGRTLYSPNLMSILLNKRGQNVVLMSWRVSLKVCFNNTLRETQKTVAFAKCAILWYLASTVWPF